MRIKDLFISVLFLIPLFSIGQPAGFTPVKDLEKVTKNIAEVAKNIKTIESEFVQEKNLSVLSEKMVSKGYFSFKHENKLRWEYKDPFNYLVVLNDGKILIRDNNKENKFDMQSNKLFKEINNIIISSVQGNVLNNKSFTSKIFENKDLFLIELKPATNAMKEFMETIQVYFDKEGHTVTRINMIESSGDNTEISFINKKINLEVPDEKFSLK